MDKNINKIETVDINDVEIDHENKQIENHKTRKNMIKNYLKNTPIEINNKSTSEYKSIKHKEKNINIWFDRIKKSKEYGDEIKKINTQNNIQKNIENNTIRDEKNKKIYIELFGEDIGTQKFNKMKDKEYKRIEKKLNKKKK